MKPRRGGCGEEVPPIYLLGTFFSVFNVPHIICIRCHKLGKRAEADTGDGMGGLMECETCWLKTSRFREGIERLNKQKVEQDRLLNAIVSTSFQN